MELLNISTCVYRNKVPDETDCYEYVCNGLCYIGDKSVESYLSVNGAYFVHGKSNRTYKVARLKDFISAVDPNKKIVTEFESKEHVYYCFKNRYFVIKNTEWEIDFVRNIMMPSSVAIVNVVKAIIPRDGSLLLLWINEFTSYIDKNGTS